MDVKKLIEVAMPIKEISAESVRDKNIKTGLPAVHQWWARRPLPVCRAVIFASLVPDPSDVNCPKAFKDAVEILLGSASKPLNEQGIAPDAYSVNTIQTDPLPPFQIDPSKNRGGDLSVLA